MRGRPPTAPEDAESRKQLIQVGLAYLTEKGYTAVGINEILRSANISKGSFYHYFKDKVDFGMCLLEAYEDYFSGKLDRWFGDNTLTALEQLQAFMTDAEAGMKRYDFQRGCLVGNLGQEIGALPEDFRRRIIDVFESWEQKTASCIALGQKKGEIDSLSDASALANYFWIGWEGAVLRAKLCKNAAPLHQFSKEFISSIRRK